MPSPALTLERAAPRLCELHRECRNPAAGRPHTRPLYLLADGDRYIARPAVSCSVGRKSGLCPSKDWLGIRQNSGCNERESAFLYHFIDVESLKIHPMFQ